LGDEKIAIEFSHTRKETRTMPFVKTGSKPRFTNVLATCRTPRNEPGKFRLLSVLFFSKPAPVVVNRIAELVLGLLVGVLRLFPLPWIARLGRLAGRIAWIADRRHRGVAIDNITHAFPDKSREEVTALARENFSRLGEAYACAMRTPGMGAELDARIEYVGLDLIHSADPRNIMVATGHFGSFDLLTHVKTRLPGWKIGTTYRAQRVKALDAVFQKLRSLTGVDFIERRGGVSAVGDFFSGGRALLALFSDQHGGGKGLWLPFLGRGCSCSMAPAVLALRHDALLMMGICYRTSIARWRIEAGPVIPTRNPDGSVRSVEAITLDMVHAYEAAIRRDPANWFWVHRRWKPISKPQQASVDAKAAMTEGETE
jgi:KDO2-lipid IV(A) lauroyltransferase